jgi:H+/Cl- antiporter ClcA
MGWWQDVRQAGRSITRNRMVSVFAVTAFALGIGVTTATFSILHGVLLTPLGYLESDRLVLVYGGLAALLAMAGGIVLVVLLASWWPPRAASRVDPMVAMRD